MNKKSPSISMKMLAAALFATVFPSFFFCSPRPEAAASMAVDPQRNQVTVVFAVLGEPGDFSMDAVVIVDGKQLRAPFTDEQKDLQKKFADEYFAPGRQYRLMFGGGSAGSVIVKKWSEGCNAVHAEVTTSTSAHLGGQVKALATSSDLMGKPASARRAPTDSERAATMDLVKKIYTQHGVTASLYRSMEVTNLTATDLDGDGKYEIIGSFTLAAKNKFERDLFLIARPEDTGMRGEFVKFQAYQPPAEGFLSGIDFVDQLDLDGDGVGEVFATQGGFDAYGFSIFKKVKGRWRLVYSGLGDAC
ncbi:MAG: hypothetical protein ABJC05_06445 [Pyrinomonadaceae bacterium]